MNCKINQSIKDVIEQKGLKLTKIAEVTNIDYQRLNRLLNQNARMFASELIALCRFLEIDPFSMVKDAA